MRIRAQTVQENAREVDLTIITAETKRDRRCRCAHRLRIENEQHVLEFAGDKNVGLLYQKGLISDSLYRVAQVDGDYRYALIFGADTSELYILSRSKTLPEPIRIVYLKKAKHSGYDTKKIVWTKQK